MKKNQTVEHVYLTKGLVRIHESQDMHIHVKKQDTTDRRISWIQTKLKLGQPDPATVTICKDTININCNARATFDDLYVKLQQDATAEAFIWLENKLGFFRKNSC